MRNAINTLFNWKQNPGAVFWLAIPLALFAFAQLAIRAYLEWRVNGDNVYMAIVCGGVLLFAVAMYPALKLYKLNQKLAKQVWIK